MERAAIYARKSTKQEGRDNEDKSVPRQIARAKEFAAKRGWKTHNALVFADDGISGTEFERRPGLQSLLAALYPRPAFDVLIVAEQKALGREMAETSYLIKQLAVAGVEVIEYVHGLSLTPKDPTSKLLRMVQGFSDEDHAVKSGERTKEALTAKFEKGYVVGGCVYGYDNVDVFSGVDAHGRPVRSHVVRVINEEEAAVVRRIFELYASGLGVKAIAKKLNNEKARPPKPFVRKDPTKVGPIRGWSPCTIRAMLTRELYRGVAVWNKTQKRDPHYRHVVQKNRPKEELMVLPVNEDLRIVSDELWKRVQSRRADTAGKSLRFADGRMSGRPPKTPTNNLLAGLATCGACGGSIVVETSGRKKGRVPEYVCYRHRNHGSGICTNQLHINVQEMNEAVLQAVEAHVLTPDAIEHVIALTERDDIREQHDALQRDLRDVEKRIDRLVQVVETASDVSALVDKLRELETRRDALTKDLRDLAPVPRLAPAVVETRLAEWRRLLRQSPTQGRAVLQRVLRGRIVFTPKGEGYTFAAETRFDKLFVGLAVERPKFIEDSTEGREHIGSADTLDRDYERLLAAAQTAAEKVAKTGGKKVGKRVASPAGFEPAFWP